MMKGQLDSYLITMLLGLLCICNALYLLLVCLIPSPSGRNATTHTITNIQSIYLPSQ